MKNGIIEKMTLIIETTNSSISKDVMKSISLLQRTVASHKDLRLSLKEEQHNSVDPYCPAGWDYWTV